LYGLKPQAALAVEESMTASHQAVVKMVRDVPKQLQEQQQEIQNLKRQLQQQQRQQYGELLLGTARTRSNNSTADDAQPRQLLSHSKRLLTIGTPPFHASRPQPAKPLAY
jgi:hypothetical protein